MLSSPYSAALTAAGGTEREYEWSLASGALPRGLTLAADGTIAGTPQMRGASSFTVAVGDSGGATAEVELTLLVKGQRWLAYTSDKTAAVLARPYLIDLLDSTFREFDLSRAVEITCPTSALAFSPDGAKLAFVAGVDANCTEGLFVVDLSGEMPGTAVRVNGSRPVHQFIGWSPDSRWLTYVDGTSTAGNVALDGDILMVDVSAEAAAPPVVVASGGFQTFSKFLWAGPTRFAWDDSYFVNAVEYSANRWQPPTADTVNPVLDFGILAAAGDRYVYGMSSSQMGVGIVFDLATTSAVFNRLQGIPSNDLTHLFAPSVLRGGVQTQLAGVYQAIPAVTAPVLRLDNATSAVWGNQSRRLVALSTSVNARFVNATAASTPTSTPLSAGPEYTTARFAPNDDWVGLRSPSQLLATSVGTTAATPVPLIAELASGVEVSPTFGFSPNGELAFYATRRVGASVDSDLYLVNLASGTPSEPRQLDVELPATATIASVSWSADSDYLIFRAGANLYIVDTLYADTVGKLLSGRAYSASFQP